MRSSRNGPTLLSLLLASGALALLPALAAAPAALPIAPTTPPQPVLHDWLVQGSRDSASISRSADGSRVHLGNGLVRRTILLSPNAATVGVDLLTSGESLIRAVEPEALLSLNGHPYAVGGLAGQPNRAYLTEAWIQGLTNTPGAFQFTGLSTSAPEPWLDWKRTRRAQPLAWPPKGQRLSLHFAGTSPETRGASVTVHHELYDQLPVLGKWLTISNGTGAPLSIDRLVVDRLAMVEAESAVDERPDLAWRTPAVTVLSDYMFKGMDTVTGNQIGRWLPDTNYLTQVSYPLKTPCILSCEPPLGPGLRLDPGGTFTSFRSWIVVHDSYERERQGLTLRRAHRMLAPWSTENPIMMHVRSADRAVFRTAVDQCAEVGFEMIIYTFGSGLNAESEDPGYLARIREDVDYAHAKGLQVGAYSLFSSRRIDDANDVIHPATGKPGGAIFGNAPCLASEWGIRYLARLKNFFEKTGLDLLEHDGPYPGDICASTSHPGHHGKEDSQWIQWQMSRDLYAWCRARGIYVNQPDYYFFAGGNKTAMGYRESNWSLPRAQQFIHARQHIYDGTWTKPQTAGWMFVPLTEYHGGGAAATIEPLREHLPDYEAHLANTLGAGVQACWRGPRLYDADETRDLVRRWVTWFKEYRDILESDVIHGRRPDGRDIDYLVHVNPHLKHRAFTMIHNPLDTAVTRNVVLPLHYAGLQGAARIREQEGRPRRVKLDPQSRAVVTVNIPAHGRTWLVVEAP